MRRRTLLHTLARTPLLAAPLLAAGCGFELKRPAPVRFGSLAMTGFAPRSPMAAELRRQLPATVLVLDDPARAEVVLRVRDDVRERSVVASTAAAQVRELQLRVRLAFHAETPGGRELLAPAELLLARDLSYRESAALAKAQEEDELFREMTADIATQLLRRLAAITL